MAYLFGGIILCGIAVIALYFFQDKIKELIKKL